MVNLIDKAKEQIDGLLKDAYESAAAKGVLPADCELCGNVEIPRDTANGDYAANHAMAGAKAFHMAPRKIAEALLAELELERLGLSHIDYSVLFRNLLV